MVVEFEVRAERGVVQLDEFRIIDGNETVLRVYVFDPACFHLRPAEQARIVQPDHRDGLIRAIAQTHQRSP